MGSRRRTLLSGRRPGASAEDADLLGGEGSPDDTPTPIARSSGHPGDEPLTDPSASGPFMAEFLSRPDPQGDLLTAPDVPTRAHPTPPPPAAERPRSSPVPSVAPVAYDAAPTRAPTPSPPPTRAAGEPSYVSFDQPPEVGAPPTDAWGEGWSPAGKEGPTPLADAPVAKDLFQGTGFDELEEVPPPTEEQPSAVMEDVGQSYSTPYSVPEPPPIPGLVDRFTPPPVQRTELGERKRKPEYLPDTPGGAAQRGFEPTPAPAAKRRAKAADADVAERSGPPVFVLLGIGAVALLGVGLILVAVMLFFSAQGGDDRGGLNANPGGTTTIETRDDMRRKPPPLGEVQPDPVPVEAPPPVDPAPTAPGPQPTQPTPGPKPVVPVAPTPKPPNPEPSKAVQPAPPSQGILKIRANRRAMVYVNNQVVGFTPLDHKVAPGAWSVAAVLPGQPTTRQERNVSISSAGGTTAVDFTF